MVDSMNEILDKLLLLFCSLILYIYTVDSSYAIIPVLIVLFLCCAAIYLERPVFQSFLYFIYLGICYFYPSYLLFLPCMMYDLFFTSSQFTLFGCFLVFGFHFDRYQPMMLIFLFLFCAICYILKYKSQKHTLLAKEYLIMKESAVELSILSEEKNRSILENQDYEINVATLNERNRIAREIHDHIGHLLSRSLLQIGALLVLEKDPVMKEGLTDLKKSLSEGMDSIRASVHNMHDESVDLYSTINGLLKDFTFCPVSFEYDIYNNPLLKLKYCFIAIIKESLSNILKHSDATGVSIVLKEQPALYQLIISDNGTVSEKTKALLRRCRINGEYSEGMGLQNIFDRIKGFRGNINITGDEGFKIYVTIPKDS